MNNPPQWRPATPLPAPPLRKRPARRTRKKILIFEALLNVQPLLLARKARLYRREGSQERIKLDLGIPPRGCGLATMEEQKRIELLSGLLRRVALTPGKARGRQRRPLAPLTLPRGTPRTVNRHSAGGANIEDMRNPWLSIQGEAGRRRGVRADAHRAS